MILFIDLFIGDANYRMIFLNVGCSGRDSDGGIFKKTSFYKHLQDKTLLNIPKKEKLKDSDEAIGYFIVGDDAFALSTTLMKPYSITNLSFVQRIFNYRLSRARRVIENSFGIMTSRFRVLSASILLDPIKTTSIVLCVCALHNFLIDTKAEDYFEELNAMENEVVSEETEEIQARDTQSDTENDAEMKGNEMRTILTNYFVNEGEVDFQYCNI